MKTRNKDKVNYLASYDREAIRSWCEYQAMLVASPPVCKTPYPTPAIKSASSEIQLFASQVEHTTKKMNQFEREMVQQQKEHDAMYEDLRPSPIMDDTLEDMDTIILENTDDDIIEPSREDSVNSDRTIKHWNQWTKEADQQQKEYPDVQTNEMIRKNARNGMDDDATEPSRDEAIKYVW